MAGDWATLPLHRALDAVDEIDRVLHLSMRGIANVAASVPLVEALANLDRVRGEGDPVEAERKIATARREADFAEKEAARDFPVLHAHATVALWGVLEATVEDLVLAYLENDPSCLTHQSFAPVRIPLAEFEQLEKPERLRLLLSEYKRNSKAELKLGIGRFETILEPVRLAGGMKEDLRRDLYEHQQVRNVIVHRGGVVDRRLLLNCPWLGFTAGTTIVVSHDMYRKYMRGVDVYFIELMVRMLVRDGFSREAAEARLHAEADRRAEYADSPPSPNSPIQPTGSAGG